MTAAPEEPRDDEIARVCTAAAWQRALGHPSFDDGLCRLVVEPAYPSLWDANHLSCVRAATEREIEEVLARAEQAFAHCSHRWWSSIRSRRRRSSRGSRSTATGS